MKINRNICFLLYDNRSGSTFLASSLNKNKDIAVSLETNFIIRILEKNDNSELFNEFKILVNFLNEEIQFKELKINYKVLKKKYYKLKKKNRINIIEIIIDTIFYKKKAKIYILKSSPYEYLNKLDQIFTNLRFINILRDGRAVYNSKKKTNSLYGHKMSENIIESIIEWKSKINRVKKFKGKILITKYEDLIINYKSEIKKIMFFLGIEKHHLIKENNYNIGNLQKVIHKNVTKKPIIENIYKWKEELNQNEINLYNFIAFKHLKSNKYYAKKVKLQNVFYFYLKNLFKFFFNKLFKGIKLLTVNPSDLKLKIKRKIKEINWYFKG